MAGSTTDTELSSLEQQLEEARKEADLTLEQLHLVQEELEVYFLRCEELEAQSHGDAGNSGNAVHLPIESIGRLMPLLIRQLPPTDLIAVAHACHRQHQHHLALPLIDAAVSKLAETDPAQADWIQMQAVRTRLSLGRRDGALRQLEKMAQQDLASQSVRHQIHFQIAWLALQKADMATAQAQLAQLEGLSPDSDQIAKLALALQLSTSQGSSPSNQMFGEGQGGASLDFAAISSDGLLIQLEGWFIDPRHPLTNLLLVRPGQVVPITPEQLDRRVRNDLAALQTEQGLPANEPVGFTILLALGPEEAVPLQKDEPLQLALLRQGADPIVLGRSCDLLNTEASTVYSLLTPCLSSVDSDSLDPQSWSFYPAGN